MTAGTIPARPTLYRGIQMRSRLEADYASALDRDGAEWEYEPTCFGAPDGQWLPDFRLGRNCYVEVKPADLLTRENPYDYVDKILRKMTVAWHSEPDALLRLVFWNYGAERADTALEIAAQRDCPWMVDLPNVGLSLLWPEKRVFDAARGFREQDFPAPGAHRHELEAEQAVLGAMMLSRSAIEDVIKVMHPADHYRPAHQLIHDAILNLYGRGEAAEAVNVASLLAERGEIARCGGAQYLAVLLNIGRPDRAFSMACTIRHLAAERTGNEPHPRKPRQRTLDALGTTFVAPNQTAQGADETVHREAP